MKILTLCYEGIIAINVILCKDLLQRTAGALQRTTQGAEKSKETGVRLQELSSYPVSSRNTTNISAPKEETMKVPFVVNASVNICTCLIMVLNLRCFACRRST